MRSMHPRGFRKGRRQSIRSLSSLFADTVALRRGASSPAGQHRLSRPGCAVVILYGLAKLYFKPSIHDTNFHVCNANIELINCMIDLVRKFPAAISTPRSAHPRCGRVQFCSGPLALAVTCLDSGIAHRSLQASGQAPAISEIRLPADCLQQFRSLIDGVGCDIATMGQASAWQNDEHCRQKRTAQGPGRFSHAAFP
jgi:hypothetical protein